MFVLIRRIRFWLTYPPISRIPPAGSSYRRGNGRNCATGPSSNTATGAWSADGARSKERYWTWTTSSPGLNIRIWRWISITSSQLALIVIQARATGTARIGG